MKPTLRRDQPLTKQTFDSVGCLFDRTLYLSPLRRRKAAKHPVGDIAAGDRWPRNSEPNTEVLFARQMLVHRPEAVVTSMATPNLEPEPTHRQIEFVVDDHNRLRAQAVEGGRRLDRLAAEVHEGLGLQ